MSSSAPEAESFLSANRPSQTAQSTAFLRALATRDDRPEIRGADDLAELFLPDDQRRAIEHPATRTWVMKNRLAVGMYEFMIARTAFFDGVVEQALGARTPQVVFLGAGYDSRPYRFKDLIDGSRIFELDAEPTQARKLAILRQAGISIPAQVTFVPVDFNLPDWSDRLLDAGFDREARSVFVWEGVTYYLHSDVIDATLRVIASISAAGSELSFDYAALSEESLAHRGVDQLRGMMRSDHPGEPTQFGIPAGTIEAFMLQRGYSLVEHLNAAEMERRFLTLRDGSSAGRVPALFSLARAKHD